MAVATTSFVESRIRPACKRRLQRKPSVVVVDDTRLPLNTFHKESMFLLMDIYEKESMPKETYESKIAKIAELVSTHEDAESVLKTFSHLSVLDRYRHGNREVMFSVMRDVDGKIKKSSLHLEKRFRQACVDLLERISTIENLDRLDADLVCFLCKSCKVDSLKSLLGEIGRSVWPYVKRPLWTSEVFVDMVVDIFETIGKQLSELHPTNFMMAWDVIRRNFILSSSKLSSYSKLRLLSLIEFYRSGWRRSMEQTRWYRTQYDNEFVDPMKKEVMTFLGLLSSKRKTSLSVKPGRSAADFIKRRQSSQSQLVPDQTSMLTTLDEPVKESSEDVFEETEDKNHLCVDVQQEMLTKNRFKENLSGKSHVAEASLEETHFMEKSTEGSNNKFDESGNTETDKFDKYKEDVEVQKIKSQDRGGISSKEDEKTAAESEGTLEGKEDDKEEKNDVFKANDSTWQRDTNNLLEGENVRDREEDIENLVLSPSSSCEGFGTWKNDNNNNHKRFFDRKKEIVKVPTKFAGRVIGAHGSVVLSIQEETGARVSTLSKPREKENEENMQDESSEECRFEIVGNDESVAKAKAKIEEILEHMRNMENSQDDEARKENYKRSFHLTKKVYVKIARKYVGRVIGFGGSSINTIKTESGARINVLHDKNRRSRFKNIDECHKAESVSLWTEKKSVRNEMYGEKSNIEVKQETSDESESRLNESKAMLEQITNSNSESAFEEQHDEEVFSGERNLVTCENLACVESKVESNEKIEENEDDELEIEIIGTDEAIEIAKAKIENIVKSIDNPGGKYFARSYSCCAPSKGFRPEFKRSQSCPVVDWGDWCGGDCSFCLKGSYCRSFLLQQSQSPTCWRRPEALSLSKNLDWVEVIVKVQVDDPLLWKPRKSSNSCMETTEDVCEYPSKSINGCESNAGQVTVGSNHTENTAVTA